MTDNKRGRPKKDRTREELARLRQQVDRLESDLLVANELIEAQGKVSALLQELSRQSAKPNTKT